MSVHRFDFEVLTPHIPTELYEAMARLHADRTSCGLNTGDQEHVVLIGMAVDVRTATGAGFPSNERRGDWWELTKLGVAYVIWRQWRGI